MTTKRINLNETLRKLLYERKIKPIDLARELRVSQPTIHRILSGKSKAPHRSTLAPIAKYLGLTVEELQGRGAVAGVLSIESIESRFIPLLAWSQLAQMQPGVPIEDARKLLVTKRFGGEFFAVVLEDASMEPFFYRGSTLIVDPGKKPKDRSFVLVKLFSNNQVVFRELLIDGEFSYLKSLNAELSTLGLRQLEKNDQVLGVLIEARRQYDFET